MAHVNDESTLVVFDGYERQELEVLFQDEVVLDIEVPLFYIKSGEEEIQHYVDTVAKPDLDNHTTSKKAELDTYTGLKKEEISDFSLERQGIIEENLDNYADNTLKPQLNEFVTAAETAAGNAQASAVASSGSAAAALDSETAAASSAATAAATVNGFDAHAAEKQADFDDNAAAKTNTFNSNYEAKTASFNSNAADKTTAFNNNAASKQALVDASASAAAASAQEAANSAVAARPLSAKNITNCITAIPQDIKLELVDGVMTLKAGSKVYKANGESITISGDLVAAQGGTNTGAFAFYRSDNNTVYTVIASQTFSGTTAPASPVTATTWLDMGAKDVKVYDGTQWVGGVSLPLCIFDNQDGKVTAVTQVFNGMGYIGNSVYALPGVKGLIPNGFNADGSLNNAEFEVANVLITTNTGSTDKRNIVFNNGWMGHPRQSYYNIEDNRNYRTNNDETDIIITTTIIAAAVEYVKGRVTSLTPKTVFHAVDYNDYAEDIQKCKLIAYDRGYNPGSVSGNFTAVLQDWHERFSIPVADNVTITIDTSQLTFPEEWYTIVFEIYFLNGAKTVNLSYAGGIRWVNGLTPDFTNGRSHLVALTKHRVWGDVAMSDAGSLGE
nr:MAG TPA: hypothetical protein [Bacteriophage sp.]